MYTINVKKDGLELVVWYLFSNWGEDVRC